MRRIFVVFLVIGFLTPFFSLAAEFPGEAPATDQILIHFFLDDSGGILGITPITDEVFLWAYAPNPHAVTSVGSLGLSYDQNGNLTFRAGLEGISHFWDYGNRLVKIEIPVPIFEGGMRMGGSFEEIPKSMILLKCNDYSRD